MHHANYGRKERQKGKKRKKSGTFVCVCEREREIPPKINNKIPRNCNQPSTAQNST